MAKTEHTKGPYRLAGHGDGNKQLPIYAGHKSIARPDADFIIQTSLPVVHRNGCSELV